VSPVPGLLLAAAAALAICALLLARRRVAGPLARTAISLAALAVPASLVYDWLSTWDEVATTKSKATALAVIISHAMNTGAGSLFPISLAVFAIKRSAANRRNAEAG